MRYCSNCGKQIPASSKFCTFCGHAVELGDLASVPPEPQPESPEVIRVFNKEDLADTAYKLLEPGRVFCGYTIIHMLNKDPEGIKYIASKDGKEYIVKLFFNYRFSNLDSVIGLQTRLKRLNTLHTASTAKVVEVNQNHDPAYMVSEYIRGESLAKIKSNNPARLTETFVREVGRQLIQTASAVREQGLTLNKLTLSGIMVQESGELTVLSSGITYEEIDEREEVFNIAVLLAQLLSGNVLYKSIYNSERLKEQKFSYINGTSHAFNKLLGDCLHRNIVQRCNSLEAMQKALSHLPPIEKDDIFVTQGAVPTLSDLQASEAPKPKTNIEWTFYGLILLIIVVLAFFFIFALPKILKATGITGNPSDYHGETRDTTMIPFRDRQTAADPGAADGKNNAQASSRIDPRLQSSRDNQDYTSSPKAPVKVKVPIPSNFVYIPDGSFGFNRLKDNPNDNVFQDGFYLSRTETSQADWNVYMMPADVSFAGNSLPVDNVSWMRIIHYCNARSEKEGLDPAYTIGGSSARSITCNFSANGYRLPTEAEWEMAAKAGALTGYSGSDDPDDVAWYRDNSGGRIRAGGTKNANAYGIFDMTGNVAEWCWDWYDAKYPSALASFINPTGPDSGTLKVIRGGSVRNGEGTNLGILYRDKGDPGKGYQYVGFRLVRKH